MGLKKNKPAEKQMEVEDEMTSVLASLDYVNTATPDEAAFMSEFIDIRAVEKGSLLLREGQIANTCYYVYKGCIREYCLKDGQEITTEFYTAGNSLSDDVSKLNRTASLLNWECMTDCIISFFPLEFELEMYKRFPRLETIFRIETEKKLGDFKLAVNSYHASTPEERYHHLLKTRPELFEWVPLYHIASYLGVKPESLSRIRNRIRNAER